MKHGFLNPNFSLVHVMVSHVCISCTELPVFVVVISCGVTQCHVAPTFTQLSMLWPSEVEMIYYYQEMLHSDDIWAPCWTLMTMDSFITLHMTKYIIAAHFYRILLASSPSHFQLFCAVTKGLLLSLYSSCIAITNTTTFISTSVFCYTLLLSNVSCWLATFCVSLILGWTKKNELKNTCCINSAVAWHCVSS